MTGCHTHGEAKPWQGFHNMTLQLRKSHNSLEVDGSQMGKQVERENDLPTPHPVMHQKLPRRTKHAHLDGLPGEAGTEWCPAPGPLRSAFSTPLLCLSSRDRSPRTEGTGPEGRFSMFRC